MKEQQIDDVLNELDMMDEALSPEESKHADSLGLDMFNNVPMTVTLEVASAEVLLGELSSAVAGDVIPLEKEANEPLDVKVNGVPFAKAEVVMIEGKYALKFVSGGSLSQVVPQAK